MFGEVIPIFLHEWDMVGWFFLSGIFWRKSVTLVNRFFFEPQIYQIVTWFIVTMLGLEPQISQSFIIMA